MVQVTLQLWDTAGQERYQSLGAAFYRGAEACILVSDITNYESFDNLQNWKNNFLEKCMPKDPQNFPFFVFANKKDLHWERQVEESKIKEWCRLNGNIPHQETSAVDCECIENAFDGIT